MKSLRPRTRILGTSIASLIAAAATLSPGTVGHSTPLYWDLDGVTDNVAGAVSGNWDGANLFWNTEASGSLGTPQAGTTADDDLTFSSGNLYTAGTITLSAGRLAHSVSFDDNIAMTLSGGSLILGSATAGSGIFALATSNSANVVSSAITLAGGPSTIRNAGTGVLSITGGITGAQNLILQNNGVTANGVTIATASLNNTGTVTNSGTGTGNTLISSVIGTNVTGVVQQSTTSSLTLQGANTFTGGLTIKAGTVTINTALNVNALGAGTVTIGDSANTGAPATLTFTGAGAFPVFANPITVTGNGANLLHVTAHNPIFSAAVTLSSNLTIASNNSLGSQFTFNGGVTGPGNITVSINNTSNASRVTFGTVAVNNTGTLTFNNASVLGGPVGTGTGTNTISAPVGTNVTAITQGSNSNPLTVSGAITVGATNKIFNSTGSSLFTISGGATGTGNVTFNANSTGGITASTVAVNNTGTITNSGSGAGTTTISSVIGALVTGVTQNSATSQLTLGSALNTYTSPTTITRGTLNVGNVVVAAGASGLGNATSNIILGGAATGGILNYTGAAATMTRNFTVNAGGGQINSTTAALTLTPASGAIIVASGPVTFGGANNINVGSTTYTGPLMTGATAINKVGAGTLTFNSVTNSGVITKTNSTPINVNAGTMVVTQTTAGASSNILGLGTITITPGAALTFNSGGGASVLTLPNPIVVAAGAATATISGNTGALTSTGAISFAAGSTATTILRLSNTNGVAGGSTYSGAITGTGTINLNPSGAGSPITLSGAQNQTGAISNVGTNTSTVTLSGAIGANITGISQAGANPFTVSASVPLSAGLNSFTSTGAGAFNFTNANTFSGTQALAFNANGTGGINVSGTNLNHTGTVTNSGTNIGTTTISSAIGANVTNITENSATSALILSGTNAFTGSSNATLGLLQFTNVLSLPNFGTVTQGAINVGSGGILGFGYAGANQFTEANITSVLGGTIAVPVTWAATGSSIGLDTSAASVSYTPAIANPSGTTSFGLVKLGTNTLTLGTSNTFTGPTAIRNGTLSVSSLNNVATPLASSSLGAPTNAANGTISLGFGTTTGVLSYTGSGETTDRVIDLAGTTGGGTIDQAGGGLLTISGNMTFTGVGAKTLTFSNSAGTANTTYSGSIVGGTLNGAAQSTTPLTLTKTGNNTLTLSGTSNSATTLILGGGILDIGANGLTLANASAVFAGNGVLANTGSATINGTGGGVLTLSSGANAGDGANFGTANLTTLTVNVPISIPTTGAFAGQSGAFEAFAGANTTGTIILNGIGTWAGNTNIYSGTVQVSAIGDTGSATSPLGQGSVINLAVSTAPQLSYTGSGEITNRTINLGSATTGGVIDASGTTTTASPLTFSSALTTTANGAKVLTLQGTGAGVFAGAIVNSTGTTGITKAGTGTWTLSGPNTYTGATTVNAGNLILGSTGSLANTGITINAGGTLSPRAGFTVGNTATAAAGGVLTLNAGGTLNLADGVIGNFNLVQNATFAGNAATFAGGSIIFDIGGSVGINDQIDVRLNDVSGTGQATSSGLNGISINPIAGSLAIGNYTLINAAAAGSTLNNAHFYLASPNVSVGGTLYNLSLSGTTGSEVLIIGTGGAAATPSTAFWQGTQADGKWNSQPSGSGTATNWASGPSGSPDTFATPGSITNVVFTANSATNLSTTLEQSFTINSLTFTGGGTANAAGSTIASGTGTNTLTLNAAALTGNPLGNGITVLTGSGANTISALVALGASQNWTNNSTNLLSVTGGISGTGFGLTVAGPGTVALGNANTFDGALSIGSGATAGTASVSAGGALGANAVLNLGGTTGAGTLVYTGTGETVAKTVNLAGTTGGGVIDQSGTGILKFSNALTATGVGAKTLTLQGSTAGTGEFSGAIVNDLGTTAVTKTGTGTWTLSGANTYTGATLVNNGTLKTGSITALSSGSALTVTSPGTLDLGGFNNTVASLAASTGTITDSSSPGSGGILQITGTTGTAIAATVTGSVGFQYQNNNGANALFSNAANTYSGGTYLGIGTTRARYTLTAVTVGNGVGVGLTSGIFGTGVIHMGRVTTDQGQIYVTGAGTINNPITYNSVLGSDVVGGIRLQNATNTATFNGVQTAGLSAISIGAHGSTGTLAINGQLTGSGTFSGAISNLNGNLGAGNVIGTNAGLIIGASNNSISTVILNNSASNNNYTGDTYVTAQGVLQTNAANQLPSGASTGNLYVNGGTVNMQGNSQATGLLSGTGNIDGISGTPTLTIGGNNATGLNFSGVIRNTAGTLALTKIGSGTQTLSGANTYSGITSITGGTLAFSAANNLGNASATNTITLDGATLSYTGSTSTNLAANQVMTIGGSGGTLNAADAGGTLNILGGITTSGTANLTKTGLGTVAVTGATNLNGGNVTVSAGVLNAAFTSTGGVGAINVADAATLNLYDGATTTTAISGLTLAAGSSLGFDLNAPTVNDVLNLTGTASVAPIVSLNFNNLGGLATGTYDLINVTGGTLTAGNYALGLAPSGFNYAFSTVNTDLTLRLTTSALNLVYWQGDVNGSWSENTLGATNWATSNAGTTDLGALPVSTDTLVFSATNATGPAITTTLDGSRTADGLQFTANPSGVTSVAVNQGTGGTLTLTPASANNGISVATNAGAISIGAPVATGAAQTWEVIGGGANGSSLAVSGAVTFNHLITKTGAGVLTLSGANSGAGGFTLAGGTVNINNNTALGTGTFTIGSGTTIDSTVPGIAIGNAQIWDGSFTFTGSNSLDLGTNAVTLAGNPTVTTSASTLTVGGAVGGTSSLSKAGAGTLILSGANSYTGATTISGGVLRITNGSALGATSSGTTQSGASALELDGSGGSVIVGAEALTIAGGGITNFGALRNIAGNNTYGGTVTMAVQSRINSDSGTLTLSNSTAVTGAGLTLVVGGAGNTTISGAITTGTGGLAKDGTGVLTLGGNNTYTGATTVTAGRLSVTGSVIGSTTGGNVVVSDTGGNNAVLNIGGNMTFNRLTVGTVTGAAGAVNLSAGTVNAGADNELTFTFGAGGTTGGYGYLGMTGGAINTSRFQFGGQNVAAQNGVGVGLISGGTVTATSHVILSRFGASQSSLTIATGGTLVHTTANNINLGWQGTGRADLNLTGGTITNNGFSVNFGGGTWTGTGVFNANAGMVTTNAFTSTGTSYLNLNGGTLRAATATATFIPTTVTAAYVNGAFGSFAGGAVFDTNSVDITVPEELITPTGSGVTTIPVTTGGSGYIGAPYISITDGGAGFGASAIANMVDDGSGNGTFAIGSITITNPGNNYTAPAVSLVGGGNGVTAAALGTFTTAANTSGGLTKIGVGTLVLSGANTYTGPTAITTGTLEVQGSIASSASISNATALVFNSASAQSYGNVISGVGTLTKQGTGTLTLSGNSIYNGGTSIAAGIILADHNNALGSGAVTFNGGTRLLISTGLNVTNPITIGANTGAVGNGLIQAGTVAGTATVSGAITINSGAAAGGHFAAPAAGTILHVAGPISSAVTVSSRIGTVMFSGGGTGYSNLTVGQGTVMVGANNGIATTATVLIASSGAGNLDLNGFNQSVAGMTKGANAAIIGNSSTTADSVLTTTGTSTYAGIIQDVIGAGTQKVGLTVGSGALTLSGANTYTGTTIVNGGQLIVSGTLSGSAVTVNGGTLGGDGTIAQSVTVNAGGTLAPGNSPGILDTGALSFVSGSTLAMEIDGTLGTQYDQLNVTGAVTLGGATLTLGGTYLTTPLVTNDTFTLILNDGDSLDPVVGTFAGLAEGAHVYSGLGQDYTISYVGGNGNDVILTAVPEPGSAVLLLGGLLTIAGLRRRRA